MNKFPLVNIKYVINNNFIFDSKLEDTHCWRAKPDRIEWSRKGPWRSSGPLWHVLRRDRRGVVVSKYKTGM